MHTCSAIHDCAGCPRPKVLSSELINAHHQHTRVVPPGACDQINFVKELVIATSLRTQAACTLPSYQDQLQPLECVQRVNCKPAPPTTLLFPRRFFLRALCRRTCHHAREHGTFIRLRSARFLFLYALAVQCSWRGV